ncbi:MAG: hypothetical protein WBP81_06175, partial [Solirubrobacteraceae bacterium]
FAQPVGLAEKLVKALLDLFTQPVDHLGHILAVGERRRSYTSQLEARVRRRFVASGIDLTRSTCPALSRGGKTAR